MYFTDDWFYFAASWTCRATFRFTSRWTLALGGLCGVIIIFAGLAYAIRSLVLRL